MAEKTLTIHVSGMSSDHCAESVNRAINTVPGLSSVDVSVENSSALVTFDDALATIEDFTGAIALAGYGATAV